MSTTASIRDLFEALGQVDCGDLAAELAADCADDDESDMGYGAFKGGDPRLFTPDEQVCTVDEIEAHRKACEEADAMEARGEVPDWPSSHGWEQHGEVVMHVTLPMFGLGVYHQGVSDV